MKNTFKPLYLKLIALSGGLLGALLRIVLYTTAIDGTGLLQRGHWARTGLLALSVLLCVLLAAGCRLVPGSKHGKEQPQSLIAGIGCFLGAGGFLMTALSDRTAAVSGLDQVSVILSLLSAAALVYVGIHRCIGRKPSFAAHGLVCISFALRMVCQYRLWSSDPQLSDYNFYMLSHVGLMLTGYHFAALDAGEEQHRRLWFFGLISIFFCLTSLYGNMSGLFMLLCALWVLTNLPPIVQSKPKRISPTNENAAPQATDPEKR